MTIQVGDRLPDVPITIAAADGPKPTTTGEFFKGKRIALFAVPCSWIADQVRDDAVGDHSRSSR